MRRRMVWVMFLAVMAATSAFAGGAKLQDGDFVAICGDSITEQKQYSVFIEDYLLMCQPAAALRAMQFGWGGETSWGFKGRMANDCLPLKPAVATTCYGMNDGGYRPFDPNGQGKAYRDAQRAVVQAFKGAGVRLIVVGSPGVVDAETFRRNPEQAIRAQQNYETPLVKELIHRIPGYKQMVPDEADALDRIRAGAEKRAKALFDAAAAAAEPVKHTIRIE